MKYACLFGSGPVPWRNIAFLFFSFVTIAFAENSFSQNHYSGNTRYPSTHSRYLLLNEVNRYAARHFRDNFSTDGTEHWLREQNYLVARLNNGALRQKCIIPEMELSNVL
ncbi:MAG: hypothetical protein JST58_19875 [Bacteroidetes bacterium]|nr:hypothetical protein [Bacteroidota bacterium]